MKDTNWKDINWKSCNLKVFELQYKIFTASRLRNKDEVKKLQKTLVKIEAAKFVAVRKVTQDNRGKNTPGVDGIMKLDEQARTKLARSLRLDGSASPIKRVYIPKANGKLRPLGIPTIQDRAKQCLLKLALEPEWEARFDINSYGFRPGYSTADAKWVVSRQIQGAPKYFLDADIKGCYDNISHEYLLEKLKTFGMFYFQIKAWLKAGILENDMTAETELEENQLGTPQGGVISPLLANIALNGMEKEVMTNMRKSWNVKFVRYADDVVILAHKLEHIESARAKLEEFLKPVGLELSKEKTKLGHTLFSLNGDTPGLNYLGYNFRNYHTGKHTGVKNTRGVKQNFRQRTCPSKKAVTFHKKVIKKVLLDYKNAPLPAVIEALSSKIRGWTHYHAMTQSTKTFSSLDGWIWKRLWLWSVKRHKTAARAKKNCFNVSGWKFGFYDKQTNEKWMLKRYDQIKVRKYIKINPGASIYNNKQTLYFAKRLALHHPMFKRLRGLLNTQNGTCAYCGTHFRPDDIIELHHKLDKNGKRLKGQLQFVHNFCHDKIHQKVKTSDPT
jgi:RNA-directed DNA polymerase